MPTTEERLKAIDKKIELAKLEKQKLKARAREQERKDKLRKKILVGGIILAEIRDGGLKPDWLDDLLDRKLTRDYDRKLFDLKPIPKTDSTSPGDAPASGWNVFTAQEEQKAAGVNIWLDKDYLILMTPAGKHAVTDDLDDLNRTYNSDRSWTYRYDGEPAGVQARIQTAIRQHFNLSRVFVDRKGRSIPYPAGGV